MLGSDDSEFVPSGRGDESKGLPDSAFSIFVSIGFDVPQPAVGRCIQVNLLFLAVRIRIGHDLVRGWLRRRFGDRCKKFGDRLSEFGDRFYRFGERICRFGDRFGDRKRQFGERFGDRGRKFGDRFGEGCRRFGDGHDLVRGWLRRRFGPVKFLDFLLKA